MKVDAGVDVETGVDDFSTASGVCRGFRAAADVVAVLGIPYAAAPFGAHRFRAPLPVPAWTGVRDCTRFGPVAPQSAELPGAPVWSPGDEDVLTVNVWTPAHDGGRLPVLVWIHGGAYGPRLGRFRHHGGPGLVAGHRLRLPGPDMGHRRHPARR